MEFGKTVKTFNRKSHKNEKMAVNEKEPYFNIIFKNFQIPKILFGNFVWQLMTGFVQMGHICYQEHYQLLFVCTEAQRQTSLHVCLKNQNRL